MVSFDYITSRVFDFCALQAVGQPILSQLNIKVLLIIVGEATMVVFIIGCILLLSRKEMAQAQEREWNRERLAAQPPRPRYENITTSAFDVAQPQNVASNPFSVPIEYGRVSDTVQMTDIQPATTIEFNGGNKNEVPINGSVRDSVQDFAPYQVPIDDRTERPNEDGASSLFDIHGEIAPYVQPTGSDSDHEPQPAMKGIFEMIGAADVHRQDLSQDELHEEQPAGSIFDVISKEDQTVNAGYRHSDDNE